MGCIAHRRDLLVYHSCWLQIEINKDIFAREQAHTCIKNEDINNPNDLFINSMCRAVYVVVQVFGISLSLARCVHRYTICTIYCMATCIPVFLLNDGWPG